MNKNTENKATKSAAYARMSTRSRKLLNAAFIIIFILVFAGVNVLTMALVNRFPGLEKDWTEKGTYTLNSTTKEYMKYLEKDVNIKVLMDEQQILSISSSYGYQVNRLLKEMSLYDKVNVEYLDIVSTSVKAMSAKYPDIDWTNADNLLIVEDPESGRYKGIGVYDVFAQGYDSNYEPVVVGQYLEQTVLTELQGVLATETFKVALSTGNGEFFNANSAYLTGYTYLPYFLEDNAYELDEINLLTQTPSDDIDVIFMLAPSVDLTSEAADKLTDWLENNGDYGKTLFYVPFDHAGNLPNIELLLEQWGLKVKEGYISEKDMTKAVSLGSNRPDLTPLMSYYDDTFTENLQNSYLSVIMPYCMPIEILDSEIAVPMLVSSETADILLPSSADESGEITIPSTGEALVGAAASAKVNDDGERSHIVVWGAYDGLKNDWTYSNYSSNVNNITYFINLLNTLTDNDAKILVESVDVAGDSLLVTSSQKVTVGIIFIFVIPVAVMVTGIIIWNRRRHR